MARIEIIGLERLTRDLNELTGDISRRLMVAVDRHLVAASPVDTGRFRANWNASDEIPALDNIPAGEYSAPTGKSPSDWSKDAAIMWNTNNLQYAKPLADGYSPQAGPGWIPDAIRAGISEL